LVALFSLLTCFGEEEECSSWSHLLLAPTVPRTVEGMCELGLPPAHIQPHGAKDVLCHRCADDGAEC